MEGIFKNMFNWIYSNLHIDLIKYMTDSQVYTSKNLLQVMNELMKQEVKSDSIQYYNIHQDSILLNTVTEKYIYNNYSFTSYVNWEIEKTPETHWKKLEFNIDKPEIGLKKVDLNVNLNDDEIDDMNDKK